jgi:hypothetical protein
MVKKTSRKRNIAISAIIVVFGIIVVVGLYQNYRPYYPISAQEYFQVVDAGIIDADVQNNGTIYIVKAITLTIKAVKGDANEVVVQSWGYSLEEEIGYMKKDDPKTISLFSTFGVKITKQPDGLLTSIRISSLEASGEINFFLPA